MADEVKLITFAGETVSPLYDGLIQELYTGGGGIITGAVVTIKDASTLHITGGYGALCGREFEIFASDIPVTLSSSGTLKGRLYLHMDLAQSGSPIELLVEVASSLTPVVQDSDVNTTNGVYEVNLATFDVGTSAISNLVDVSPKLSKIPDQISLLNSALTDLEIVDLSNKIHTNQNFNPYLLSMKKQGNIYIIDYSMYAASAFNAGQARQLFLIDDVTLAPGIHATGLHLNSSQAYKGIMRVYSTATDIRFESTAAGAVNDFFEGQIVFTLNN